MPATLYGEVAPVPGDREVPRWDDFAHAELLYGWWMHVARPSLAVALVLAGAVSACGDSDGDDPIRTVVLDCIADGGGEVGADADVAIVDGQAMSVIGEVEATDDLVASCLDRASG